MSLVIIELLLCIPGLLLLRFIALKFRDLALKFDVENPGGWAMVGVAGFYAGVFAIGWILLYLIDLGPNRRGDASLMFLIMFIIPIRYLLGFGGFIWACFGMMTSIILYYRLKKRWKTKRINERRESMGKEDVHNDKY